MDYLREVTLINKDSKGKLRVVQAAYKWDEEKHGFVIHRLTGCYKGKMIEQPELLITKGKVKRTVTEQVELEFNSIIKKYKDKAYIELEKSIDDYTYQELEELLGDVKLGQDGIVKPMLAKQADKVSKKVFDKEYYASRKINGCRCLIWYRDGRVQTSSRGAINYNIAIIHILQHPILEQFFENHPDAILDGEIFKFGMSLNTISGICRSQATVEDGKDLQFYWYDIVDLTAPFSERYKTMQEWSKEFQLSEFDPERSFLEDELAIQFLPQVKISGWDNIKKLHDKYVSEGWEGLVIRLASSAYKPGSRGNDWIKIKEYFDDTFRVVGYELGLRGSEDMTFICEMKDGKTFNASPMGDRATKEEYVANFEEKYINRYGDCKYFELSPYGIPQQPKFIAFRGDGIEF